MARGTLIVIFIISAIVCAWDVYAGLHGRGNTLVAWVLAIVMALVAVAALRKLIRQDYSNSLW